MDVTEMPVHLPQHSNMRRLTVRGARDPSGGLWTSRDDAHGRCPERAAPCRERVSTYRWLRVSRVSKGTLDSRSKIVEHANVDAAARAAAVTESAASWSRP
jgi:hypothetical protein